MPPRASSIPPFRPAWWLPGGHLQTLWPTFFRRICITPRRQRLTLPDGDFIDIDWLDPASANTDADRPAPIVIVLHGLEGSIDSPYARGILLALARAGFRAVMFHFRGCSGQPNRTLRSYHSGDTRDFAFLINHLHQQEPHTPLAAVGFSIGGNVLLKHLGECGDHHPLTAAVAVSVPFDLHIAAARLDRGLSRIYQAHLLQCLRRTVREKITHLRAAGIDHPPAPMPSFDDILRALPRLRSFREFDDAVTAPLNGFADVDDYYTRASCRPHLRNITTPTLILHARNDPFMTPDAIPTPDELSPAITMEIPSGGGGGHVGFITGRIPFRPIYWLDQRIPAYLTDHLTTAPPASLPSPSPAAAS